LAHESKNLFIENQVEAAQTNLLIKVKSNLVTCATSGAPPQLSSVVWAS
jgi:hypothetical protein